MRTIDKLLVAALRELVKIEIRVGERGGGSIQVYAPFEGAEHFEFTITIPGYSAEEIFHQFRILFKHGLVETDISGDPIIVPYMNFSRVTDAGHQLLADCDAEPSPPPNPIGFVHF